MAEMDDSDLDDVDPVDDLDLVDLDDLDDDLDLPVDPDLDPPALSSDYDAAFASSVTAAQVLAGGPVGYLAKPTPRGFTAKEIEMAEVDIEAVRLRKMGKTYQEIATEMESSMKTAKDRVKRSLMRWYQQETEEVRVLEMTRLDMATGRLLGIIEQETGIKQRIALDEDDLVRRDEDGHTIYEAVLDENGDTIMVATRGDDDRAIRAIEKLVMVSARRAALLGLDQPKRLMAEMTIDGNIKHEHEVAVTVLDAFREYTEVLGEIVTEERGDDIPDRDDDGDFDGDLDGEITDAELVEDDRLVEDDVA